MKDKNRTDDLDSLFEQAKEESDPKKLLELIAKINRLLEERRKQRRKDEASFKVDALLFAD